MSRNPSLNHEIVGRELHNNEVILPDRFHYHNLVFKNPVKSLQRWTDLQFLSRPTEAHDHYNSNRNSVHSLPYTA